MKIKEPWRVILDHIFILVSCIEMVLGILYLCKYEIPHKRFILWGFLAVYLLKALSNTYSRNEKLIFIATIVIGCLLYFKTGINTGIKAPVYIFAMKEVDKEGLFKGFLLSMLTSVGAIFIGSIFWGLGTSYVKDVRFERGFGGIRYSLGFSSPNITQFILFVIMVYIILLYYKRLNGWKLGIMAGVYLGVYCLTNCYTGLVMGILLLLSIFLLKKVKWDKLPDALWHFFIAMMVFFLVVALWAASGQERSWWMETINQLISGRMDQLVEYTNDMMYALPSLQNWHLFSDRLNKNWYDLGYVQIFYYYGTVMGSCYLLFVGYAMSKARKRKDIVKMILTISLCIYLFMESRYFMNYLTSDYLLMIAAATMWGGFADEYRLDSEA